MAVLIVSRSFLGKAAFGRTLRLGSRNQNILLQNPMKNGEIRRFLFRYTTLHQSDEGPANLIRSADTSSAPDMFLRCPVEIKLLIMPLLPLRSGLNLCATSRTWLAILPLTTSHFWFSHTLQLHSDWLWQLRGFEHSTSINWKAVLQALEATRRDTLLGPESYRGRGQDPLESKEKAELDIDTTTAPLQPPPMELKNRLRVWMFHEFFSK